MLTVNEIGPTPNNSRKCPPKCKQHHIDRDTKIYVYIYIYSHWVIWDDINTHFHKNKTYNSSQVHALNYMWPSNWAQALDKSIFKWLIILTIHSLYVCVFLNVYRIPVSVSLFEWWRFEDSVSCQWKYCEHSITECNSHQTQTSK